MRWLVLGDLPSSVADALRRHGHDAKTADEAGVGTDDAVELLKTAHRMQLDVVTASAAVVSAAEQLAAPFGRCIVSIQTSSDRSDDAIDRLFERYKRLSPQRVYTITDTRVKVRQLPGKQ